MKSLKVLFCFLLLSLGLLAQGTTSSQQSSQRLDAATLAGTSATSAATITITVPGNQFFYMTGVDIINCASGTVVTAAAVTTVSTTNFAGGGPAYTVGSGVAAGLCTSQTVPLSVPLKSAVPGTNVTFVLPAFATNQTIRVNVYGYFGS